MRYAEERETSGTYGWRPRASDGPRSDQGGGRRVGGIGHGDSLNKCCQTMNMMCMGRELIPRGAGWQTLEGADWKRGDGCSAEEDPEKIPKRQKARRGRMEGCEDVRRDYHHQRHPGDDVGCPESNLGPRQMQRTRSLMMGCTARPRVMHHAGRAPRMPRGGD